MKAIISTVLLLIGITLAGCSNEDLQLNVSESEKTASENPTRISLSEALQNAEALLNDLSATTRNSSKRVASVDYITSQQTRSVIDTTMYLVNYENNGGFALLAADIRIPEVLAISPKGELHLSDTIEDKGLAAFFRNANEIAAANIVLPIDTTNYRDYDYIYRPLFPHILKECGPLLTNSVRQWDQSEPFNKYCALDSVGKPGYVGCCALATAQYCSYFEHPKVINNLTLDWDGIKNGTNTEQVYQLLAYISKQLGVNPDNGGTSAYNIGYFLKRLGYKPAANHISFSVETITNNIDKALRNEQGGGPSLINGFFSNSNLSGHEWVIDGYALYGTGRELAGVEKTLLHCCWGWRQKSDGYFLWADGNWAKIYLDNPELPLGKFNYNAGLKMITGLYL